MKYLTLLLLISPLFADPIVDRAVAELEAYAQLQKKVSVQDPDLAYGMRKALMMADLLFDESGKLLLERASDIKQGFLPSLSEDYEVDMNRVLGVLNASWQPLFDAIKAPSDSLLLQGLFSTQKISDRHAKVAVLAALLAPYNQGSVGDCFAVSDVIREHEEYLKKSAGDYASIVQNGYVERMVDEKAEHFYFLLQLADDDRGQVVNLDFPLFDAPGFAAARTLLGGDNHDSLESQVRAKLSSQPTPGQVIEAMAEVLGIAPSSGLYAFSCLTNNPVLRATEAAFAAMAEERPNDSIRQNIHDALHLALQSVLADDKSFLDTFNASYRLVYNLDIPLPAPSDDGSSTDGGFQLYTKKPDSIGTRVESPLDFQNLVVRVMAQVMIHSPQVLQYVHSPDFMKAVLWNYDPANKKDPDPVSHYKQLARTPMQCCDGDDPYAVDDIDSGSTYETHVQTYTPTNTKDLMNWVMGLAKAAPAGPTGPAGPSGPSSPPGPTGAAGSSSLYPMDTPQHAFNFTPGLPELVAFCQSGLSPDQWLQQKMVIPGMQLATQIIDNATKQKVIQGLLDEGLTDSPALETLAQNLAKQKLSVQACAQKLLDGLNQLFHNDPNQMAIAVDIALLQALPSIDQALLARSAVRFAFTNWNDGTEDIYFCAFFNPRTQQIAFGSIDEDRSNLSPMSEADWVNGQEWDVDMTLCISNNHS